MHLELLLSAASYKSFLRDLIADNHTVKAFHSRLAEAAGCQKSYLSKVLNDQAHLTPDHIMGLAEYLQFNETETEYLLELLHLERAATPLLKERQKKKLHQLRKQFENLKDRFKATTEVEQADHASEYYSSWAYAAVHIACGISSLSTANALAKRLKISEVTVKRILKRLEVFGLVESFQGQWKRTEDFVHIPAHSPMNTMNHFNWSLINLKSLQEDEPGSLHYTGVCSLAKNDVEKIKQILITSIGKTRDLIKDSKDEELLCVRVDMFTV